MSTDGSAPPVPVLLYHGVGEDTSGPLGPYTLPLPMFRDHMSWIADQGYTTLTVRQLTELRAGRRTLPPRPLVITFDDGLADFFDHALPVLRSFGHASTMFVTTAATWSTAPRTLGGRLAMSANQIAEAAAAGVEMGGHGHEHSQLDLLPAARVRAELHRCRDRLEQIVGTAVVSFAYPHGYHRATTRRLVREAGFTSACAVRNRISHLDDDLFALARIMLTSGQGVSFLERGLGGALPRAGRGGRVRAAAWRAARLVRTRGRPEVRVERL
ncbi:polysaccharide deacetylase family protein [Georgenia daeguensis]|uniref:NodB homology domain-containing protein n=1 Tax=Georgenia daeguensis TaxID=908355 RepID=A0ABP8EQA5_9MICO